jgi:hypothetical protein
VEKKKEELVRRWEYDVWYTPPGCIIIACLAAINAYAVSRQIWFETKNSQRYGDEGLRRQAGFPKTDGVGGRRWSWAESEGGLGTGQFDRHGRCWQAPNWVSAPVYLVCFACKPQSWLCHQLNICFVTRNGDSFSSIFLLK